MGYWYRIETCLSVPADQAAALRSTWAHAIAQDAKISPPGWGLAAFDDMSIGDDGALAFTHTSRKVPWGTANRLFDLLHAAGVRGYMAFYGEEGETTEMHLTEAGVTRRYWPPSAATL